MHQDGFCLQVAEAWTKLPIAVLSASQALSRIGALAVFLSTLFFIRLGWFQSGRRGVLGPGLVGGRFYDMEPCLLTLGGDSVGS